MLDFKDRQGNWVRTRVFNDVKDATKSYQVWLDIRKRCNPIGLTQKKEPSYIGCSMSDLFQDFNLFADWHTEQVGYGLQGYQIDKDILLTGNKVYCEDFCVLVPQALNNFLLAHERRRGPYPQGMSLHKRTGKLQVEVSGYGTQRYIGLFDTVEAAMTAYKRAKDAEARLWVGRLKAGEFVVDRRVIDALDKWEFKH
jgi:hypothetical protein